MVAILLLVLVAILFGLGLWSKPSSGWQRFSSCFGRSAGSSGQPELAGTTGEVFGEVFFSILGLEQRRDSDARQETEREEREAVRGSQEQGHVEGTCRTDRQFPRRFQARWRKVRIRLQPKARRDDRSEESGRQER